MRVKYIGETDPIGLISGKIYDVISIENSWYRIVDELGIDEDEDVQGYLYPPEDFEILGEE